MRLDSRVNKLEQVMFRPMLHIPYIVYLKDGETLEEGMLREGIPDTEGGCPTFVIGVSFV